jgi:3-deoxy-7-phosphoheptulonate synthase
MGGYADLERVHTWNLGFVKDSPAGDRFQALANRITETMGFMRVVRCPLSRFPGMRSAQWAVRLSGIFTC